jgi:hypothetical protein
MNDVVDIYKKSKTDIQKDLLKSKNIAMFSRYQAGNLYYHVVIFDDEFEFGIPVTENIEQYAPTSDFVSQVRLPDKTQLSTDLGNAPFDAQIKGAHLFRWIAKSFDAGELIKCY